MPQDKKAKSPSPSYGPSIILADMAPIGRIPTGVAPFDLYTDGGIPESTMSLMTGPNSSGKTTMTIRAMAGFQRMYPKQSILYVNADNKLDPAWVETHGGNPKKIAVSFPSSTEEAQFLTYEVARDRKDVGLVVVDSLAALCPAKEGEAEPTDEQMGIAARLNNKFMRVLTSSLLELFQKGRKLTVIIINQERQSLKLYGGTVIPGGMGQQYHAALWCQFFKSDNKVDKKLGIPVTTTFRFVFRKNMGNASQWPGEVDMHMTPNGKWFPGQFQDQEFVWLWATQRLGILQNRGIKGFEYNGEFANKNGWITRWEDDPEAYNAIKKDLTLAFQDWKKGERKANFIQIEDEEQVLVEGEAE